MPVLSVVIIPFVYISYTRLVAVVLIFLIKTRVSHSQVWPLSRYPDEEVCVASQKLINEQVSHFAHARILMQVMLEAPAKPPAVITMIPPQSHSLSLRHACMPFTSSNPAIGSYIPASEVACCTRVRSLLLLEEQGWSILGLWKGECRACP